MTPDPIKDFLNAIKLQPVNFVEYDGGMITFYTYPEQRDYKVVAMPHQLREFCEVERPCDLYDLERWMDRGGVIMPEIVNEFITHSRAEWKEIVEIENPN